MEILFVAWLALFGFVVFETGSHCEALTVLELTMFIKLTSNSHIFTSACLCFPSAEIKACATIPD